MEPSSGEIVGAFSLAAPVLDLVIEMAWGGEAWHGQPPALLVGNTKFWFHTAAACGIKKDGWDGKQLFGSWLKILDSKVAQGYTQPSWSFGELNFRNPTWPYTPQWEIPGAKSTLVNPAVFSSHHDSSPCLWKKIWAVATLVPDSLSHPIPWQMWTVYTAAHLMIVYFAAHTCTACQNSTLCGQYILS